MDLVLATTNKGKIREIEAIASPLGIRVRTAGELGFTREIPEDGQTFQDNACFKALTVATELGLPALADDSGLSVEALGGAPGVYSARYAGPEADPLANNAKLLAEMKDIPTEKRRAAFICVMCCARPDGRVLTATGRFEGRIAPEPSGEGGFGYDPVFFLPERGLTVAQMPLEEKNRISHRALALRDLALGLKDFLSG